MSDEDLREIAKQVFHGWVYDDGPGAPTLKQRIASALAEVRDAMIRECYGLAVANHAAFQKQWQDSDRCGYMFDRAVGCGVVADHIRARYLDAFKEEKKDAAA